MEDKEKRELIKLIVVTAVCLIIYVIFLVDIDKIPEGVLSKKEKYTINYVSPTPMVEEVPKKLWDDPTIVKEVVLATPKPQLTEEKKPEIEPEQEIAQQKVTELAIVADEKVKEEPKSQTELEKTEEVFTAKNVESDNTNRAALENLNKQVKIDVPEPKKEEKKPEKEEVFKSVEQMPTFPGGDAALMKWLSSHIQYPTMAQENNVQGRVVVQFVVTKTGQVGEVKVVRSVDKDLDREAVRVCKSLPKFVPGRQNGQAVNVWYTLPVTFKLQGTN